MDILKAEIARKRKQLEDAKVVSGGQKYFKRADLLASQEEAYLKEHAPQKLNEAQQRLQDETVTPVFRNVRGGGHLNKQDLTRIEKDPTSRTSDGAGNDVGGVEGAQYSWGADYQNISVLLILNGTSGSPVNPSDPVVEDLPKLSRREVIRRFRERGEPITLFGENELEAFKRLRKLEILEPEVNRGFRNDLQAAYDTLDQVYLEEMLKNIKPDSSNPREKKKLGDVQVQEDDYTEEQIFEMATEVFKNKKDLEGHAQMILKWLKFILKNWGHQLNNGEEHDKLSTRGKLASATYTQTVEYLKPLMRKLKSNTLTDDILEALAEIVQFMLNKEYIKANDAYLQMAIGNAPWPIGVTMVGIHARTGREKIFSRNVAHVMNDETQRKYIQGLKRLMTKCQILFPTHPSKSVEYTPDASIY